MNLLCRFVVLAFGLLAGAPLMAALFAVHDGDAAASAAFVWVGCIFLGGGIFLAGRP